MSMILIGLMMAQARVLPDIDRRALELQARAEALGARRTPAARPPAASSTRHTHVVPAGPARTAAARPAATQRRPAPAAVRNAAGAGELDLSAITTICRAAGNQPDPAGFLATLSRAYAMAPDRSAQLRTSCAAYLAGRADARTVGF